MRNVVKIDVVVLMMCISFFIFYKFGFQCLFMSLCERLSRDAVKSVCDMADQYLLSQIASAISLHCMSRDKPMA